jgi:hypothetical protein
MSAIQLPRLSAEEVVANLPPEHSNDRELERAIQSAFENADGAGTRDPVPTERERNISRVVAGVVLVAFFMGVLR